MNSSSSALLRIRQVAPKRRFQTTLLRVITQKTEEFSPTASEVLVVLEFLALPVCLCRIVYKYTKTINCMSKNVLEKNLLCTVKLSICTP